jgi:hypothetical protein
MARSPVCILNLSEVEVALRLTVSQSVCLCIEQPCGTCDQILLPVGVLLSEVCGLISVRRPLWREDGSAICSLITQWFESRRTRNHTLLSHLRLPELGGPGSRIYIPQEQDGPVIRPVTGWSCPITLCAYNFSTQTTQKTLLLYCCSLVAWQTAQKTCLLGKLLLSSGSHVVAWLVDIVQYRVYMSEYSILVIFLTSFLVRACHWPQSWVRLNLSTPSYPVSIRYILIISSILSWMLMTCSLTFAVYVAVYYNTSISVV